jgi:hypothetical protein
MVQELALAVSLYPTKTAHLRVGAVVEAGRVGNV